MTVCILILFAYLVSLSNKFLCHEIGKFPHDDLSCMRHIRPLIWVMLKLTCCLLEICRILWFWSGLLRQIILSIIDSVKFKNRPTPASFLFIFGLFNQTLQFLQQIYVKKCPSSIRYRDLNPWPSERESPPITTRPGLPPIDSVKLHSPLSSLTS